MAQTFEEAVELAQSMSEKMGELNLTLGQISGFIAEVRAEDAHRGRAEQPGMGATVVQIETVQGHLSALGAEIDFLTEHLQALAE